MADLSPLAIGAWSGGRFMHFGKQLDDDALAELLRPDEKIATLLTADVYGCGEADRVVARALRGLSRDSYCLVGAIGHDFYEGERAGPKGFPRFTDPKLRKPSQWADYLKRATEKSLERCEVDSFDLLLLHNPDHFGYTSEIVWNGMAALVEEGLTNKIGVAPGPANGFTLDLITCMERFSELIDSAMIILNPLEPWPGELVLRAAVERNVRIITRVVDYGGLFWDDLLPGQELARFDHRSFRPKGWIESGRAKLDRIRPIAQKHNLTLLQLACQWNLAQPGVQCVVPTVIQEFGDNCKAIADKRAELASTPLDIRLTPDDLETIRTIGDNSGSMALKGAIPDFEGDYLPDQWALSPELSEVASRWEIVPERDLVLR
jgi:aryl-alcohol dehydrogenase-like predicted oxidoreductase